LSWKRTFADQTFWQRPEDLEDSKLKKHELVTKLKADDVDRIVDAVDRERFLAAATAAGVKPKQTVPPEELAAAFGSTRRITITSQKGGALVKVSPRDGPRRKVQIKPASRAVLIWRNKKDAIGLSVVAHPSIVEFGQPKVQPAVPDGATVLAMWKRYELVRLPQAGTYPEGFYRVKEFSEKDIKLLHESALPMEIAQRIGIKETNEIKPVERRLGKTELRQIFEARPGDRKVAATTSTS
jgi:hypothetical protein